MNDELSPVDFDPFADGEIVDVAPATSAQTEIWVASQFGEDAALAYNESITIDFRGPFDREAMRAALQALPRRHEALRATFSHDGKSMCVGTSVEVPVTWVDQLSFPEAEREKNLAELIARESSTRFDLEHGPLLRATIVRMAEEDHRLILGSHHIVCDGWSFAVLLKDLGPLYNAARGAPPGVLPESIVTLLPVHAFSTYAQEEGTRDATREETYWRSRFETLPEVLSLPTDEARPALRAFASERVDMPIGKELVQALKKAGARSGASLFVTLFSAFAVLMARLSEQSDLVIGIPASGQSALGREMLVGHCANLLPIRLQVETSRTFGDLLKSVRSIVLDAYDHQRFTLGAILPKLKIPRDPSRLPLVQVLFNLDTGMEGSGLHFEGLEVSFRANARVAETFELFLNAFDHHGSLIVECQYSTSLWHRETIQSWVSAYIELLTAVASGTDVPCAGLPVLSAADHRKSLVEWNNTLRAYPTDKTILDLFAERAAAHPDKAAVSDAQETLSYGALRDLTRGIAAELSKRGVGRGDLVAVAVNRSAKMVAALLGIIETGAAYIPIDPRYPADRIAPMVTAAKLVIAEPETEANVDGAGVPLVMLEDLVAAPRPDGASWKPSAAPEERAYVLFTSGSTGTPNGVQVTHRNLVNFVESMRADPGMTERDVLVAVVTLSFDIAGYELYVPLASGASIVVAETDTASDGRELAELLTRSGATVLQAPPSIYRLLRAAGYSPKGLKALAGGELLPVDLAQWMLEGGATLINCYGPTETTIWSTIHHVADASGPIPLGKPLANTTVYVLDAAGQPRPIGGHGEIYIGGDGVTLGYLNRPEITAKRFVADPFADKPGAQLHRTGDVGRWRHDGVLEFVGRNDDQVKIRGHRVELGEIEAVLATLPALAEGAVAVVREPGSDARLVAFIVPKAKESITSTEVRKHLRRKLPDAMIPQLVVEIAALPRTPNGKVDRRALARLGAGQRPREREITPPSNKFEEIVVELCERAIGQGAKFGVQDNFFEGGGDSLKCMDIVVAIESRTGVRIAPRTLILSSLADVARLIEKGAVA